MSGYGQPPPSLPALYEDELVRVDLNGISYKTGKYILFMKRTHE